MKKLRMLFILFALFLAGLNVSTLTLSQSNRQVGVVGVVCNKEDGTALLDAFVAVFRMDDKHHDSTNKDGLYCIYVPSGIGEFALVYKATGFLPRIIKNVNSDHETIKMDRVCLVKTKPNDLGQLQNVGEFVDTAMKIYQSSASLVLKRQIRQELQAYHDAIEIPPASLGMTDYERGVRLGAKAQIENTLFKLKSGR